MLLFKVLSSWAICLWLTVCKFCSEWYFIYYKKQRSFSSYTAEGCVFKKQLCYSSCICSKLSSTSKPTIMFPSAFIYVFGTHCYCIYCLHLETIEQFQWLIICQDGPILNITRGFKSLPLSPACMTLDQILISMAWRRCNNSWLLSNCNLKII